VRHRTIIPVHKLNRATADTVRYALSASDTVTAVHIAVDDAHSQELQRAWRAWCPSVPLRTVPSPYREVIDPLIAFIERFQAEEPRQPVTVMVPEVIPTTSGRSRCTTRPRSPSSWPCATRTGSS
jgi:hypothetical protein